MDPGVLVVKVVEAVDLAPKDSNGLSDPYVEVSLLDLSRKVCDWKARTRVIKETLQPQWNETFYFKLPKGQCSGIKFCVWDKDPFTSDFMGKATWTDVSSLKRVGKCEEWLSLKPRSKDRSSVITGRIHVEMGFIAREKLPEFDSFEDSSQSGSAMIDSVVNRLCSTMSYPSMASETDCKVFDRLESQFKLKINRLEDRYIDEFRCSYQKKEKRGLFTITRMNFYFHATLLGRTALVMPVAEVARIEKQKSRLVGVHIVVIMKDNTEHLFRGFLHGERAYDAMQQALSWHLTESFSVPTVAGQEDVEAEDLLVRSLNDSQSSCALTDSTDSLLHVSKISGRLHSASGNLKKFIHGERDRSCDDLPETEIEFIGEKQQLPLADSNEKDATNSGNRNDADDEGAHREKKENADNAAQPTADGERKKEQNGDDDDHDDDDDDDDDDKEHHQPTTKRDIPRIVVPTASTIYSASAPSVATGSSLKLSRDLMAGDTQYRQRKGPRMGRSGIVESGPAQVEEKKRAEGSSMRMSRIEEKKETSDIQEKERKERASVSLSRTQMRLRQQRQEAEKYRILAEQEHKKAQASKSSFTSDTSYASSGRSSAGSTNVMVAPIIPPSTQTAVLAALFLVLSCISGLNITAYTTWILAAVLTSLYLVFAQPILVAPLMLCGREVARKVRKEQDDMLTSVIGQLLFPVAMLPLCLGAFIVVQVILLPNYDVDGVVTGLVILPTLLSVVAQYLSGIRIYRALNGIVS